MKSIALKVKEFLDSNEFTYHYDKEENSFLMTMNCEYADLRICISVNEEISFVSCYSMIPFRIREGRISSIYEVLNEINATSMFAFLYYEKSNRIIVSQTGMNVDGGVVNNELLKELVGSSIRQADNSLDKILQAVYGKVMSEDDKLLFLSKMMIPDGDIEKNRTVVS